MSSASSITIGLSRSDVDTLSDDSASSSFGIAQSIAVVGHGPADATGLAMGQSDSHTSSGNAEASSAGIAAGDAVALNGDANAMGIGIGQSETHTQSGAAESASLGIGVGDAVALHGNATAVGVGIGQSEAHSLSGEADSTSHGIGTAAAAAHHGEASATAMGIAQAAAHSGTGAIDSMALGAGHGEATGASSFAVSAGTGAVEDIGQPLHGLPSEFGAADVSAHGDQHGGGRMEAILERFESTVEHLMQQAHEFLQHGGDKSDFAESMREFQSEWSIGGRGAHGEAALSFSQGDATDPFNHDSLREVAFTFNEKFTLPNHQVVSLSFAFAEEDDQNTGKAQIATGFGLGEGASAQSLASADAGFAHADTGSKIDSGRGDSTPAGRSSDPRGWSHDHDIGEDHGQFQHWQQAEPHHDWLHA